MQPWPLQFLRARRVFVPATAWKLLGSTFTQLPKLTLYWSVQLLPVPPLPPLDMTFKGVPIQIESTFGSFVSWGGDGSGTTSQEAKKLNGSIRSHPTSQGHRRTLTVIVLLASPGCVV